MNKIPKSIRKQLDDSALQIDPKFKANLKNQLFNKESTMANKKQSSTNGIMQFFKQNNAVPLLAVFIALVLVGGTSALITNNRNEQARLSEIELSGEELADVISVSDIQAIAELDEPTLSIVSIELENEDEGLLYRVKYSDGSIRYYLASDGSPVGRNSESEGYEVDESVPAGFQAGITLADARNIAQNQRPGKTITKIELETENGVVVYSVRFSDDGRVDVNATNGSVVRVRSGDDSSSSSSIDDSSESESDDDSRSGSNSDDSREVEDEKDDDKSDDSSSGSSSDD